MKKLFVIGVAAFFLLACVKELQIEKIDTTKNIIHSQTTQLLDTKENKIDSDKIDENDDKDPYFFKVAVKTFLIKIENKEYYLFQGQYDYFDILEKTQAEKLDPAIKDQNEYILTFGKYTQDIISLQNVKFKWHYTNQFEKSYIEEQRQFIEKHLTKFELKITSVKEKTI